jgi:hypothetical protein
MLFDELIDLDRCTSFLGVGLRIDDSMRQPFWLTLQNLVQGSFRMDTFPAASHESRVYNDAREPRGKRRSALKGAQAGICFVHAILKCILCIFFVV